CVSREILIARGLDRVSGPTERLIASGLKGYAIVSTLTDLVLRTRGLHRRLLQLLLRNQAVAAVAQALRPSNMMPVPNTGGSITSRTMEARLGSTSLPGMRAVGKLP